MNIHLLDLFNDRDIVTRIKSRLPYLYRLAELESSRAGKIGMEVGSVREKIVVALLIYKYGENNVETEIPIIEPEIDVRLFGNPISVKTITGRGFGGVKLIWTVDAEKALTFLRNYKPCCDILFVRIFWGGTGGFYYIPIEAQDRVFKELGREGYIKLPKVGTNPRGAEFTKDALSKLSKDKDTRVIEINWNRQEIDYHPYKRWVDYWSEE
ncbi:MAG: ThaI family type II restriction endonuclease [Dehalococcoidales bacterium]|nr:ThaI family type II restriction endonuclease [Dehalococcoidales bacterium]